MLADADQAILNVLVRLNQLLENRFPDTGVMTMSSCAGHTGVNQKHHPESPYLRIDADALRTTPDQRELMEQLLKGIFMRAVDTLHSERSAVVNLRFEMSAEAQMLWSTVNPEVDAPYYLFWVGATFPQGQNFEALARFWRAVEVEISALDEQRMITEFSEAHFAIPVGTPYRELLRNAHEQRQRRSE